MHARLMGSSLIASALIYVLGMAFAVFFLPPADLSDRMSVIIASLLNTFPYSLITLPEIKKVDQLTGGKVAILSPVSVSCRKGTAMEPMRRSRPLTASENRKNPRITRVFV